MAGAGGVWLHQALFVETGKRFMFHSTRMCVVWMIQKGSWTEADVEDKGANVHRVMYWVRDMWKEEC